jgi:hypothetical protein
MTSKYDKWVERVLSSTEGMQPAEAPPFLFTRIEARLAEAVPTVPNSRIRLAFAGGLLLVLMNVGALLVTSHDSATTIPATGSAQLPTTYASGDLSLDAFGGGGMLP